MTPDREEFFFCFPHTTLPTSLCKELQSQDLANTFVRSNERDRQRGNFCKMPAKQTAKVVLVGDSGVGKSTILSSYVGERFNHVYVQTRGEIQNAFIGMRTKVDVL